MLTEASASQYTSKVPMKICEEMKMKRRNEKEAGGGYAVAAAAGQPGLPRPDWAGAHATMTGRTRLLVVALLLLALASVPVVYAGCAIVPDANGNVEIPASYTSIAANAFRQCSSLKTVTFASGS